MRVMVLAVLLVGSVGLNGWLWRRRTAPAPAHALPAASAEPQASAQRERGGGEAKLRAELDRCQKKSWHLLGEAVSQTAHSAEHDGAKVDAAPSAAPTPEQLALCDLGRETLFREWSRDKADIAASIQRDVARPEWVDDDIAQKVAAHKQREGLADADAARLEQGYRDLWQKHIGVVRQLSADGDWDALIDEAKDFMRGEDDMVARKLGAERGRSYREADRKSRAAILAVLATLAGRSWDEAIAF